MTFTSTSWADYWLCDCMKSHLLTVHRCKSCGERNPMPTKALPSELQEAGAGPRPAGFMSLADLYDMEETETDWLVDEMIPIGGYALVVAKPKAGKSTLMRCLAHACTTGGEWLGRQVQKVPVLYITFEDRALVVKQHFQQLGVEYEAELDLYVGPTVDEPIAWLAGAISGTGAKCAVIDPLFRFLPNIQDGNDYAELTRKTGEIIDLARKMECALVITHHSRKAEGDFGDEALGSTALFGAVDAMLSIRRDGDARIISSSQREGTNLERSTLELTEDGQLQIAGSVAQQQAEDVEQAVADYLFGCADEGPRTRSEIATAVEFGDRKIRAALRSLADKNRLARVGTGKRGDPFRYTVAENVVEFPLR